MKQQELHPGRKSKRLQGFDYSSSGAYFLTVVTQDRINRFGSISDGLMQMDKLVGLCKRRGFVVASTGAYATG